MNLITVLLLLRGDVNLYPHSTFLGRVERAILACDLELRLAVMPHALATTTTTTATCHHCAQDRNLIPAAQTLLRPAWGERC